jgi:hypothetical protein
LACWCFSFTGVLFRKTTSPLILIPSHPLCVCVACTRGSSVAVYQTPTSATSNVEPPDAQLLRRLEMVDAAAGGSGPEPTAGDTSRLAVIAFLHLYLSLTPSAAGYVSYPVNGSTRLRLSTFLCV